MGLQKGGDGLEEGEGVVGWLLGDGGAVYLLEGGWGEDVLGGEMGG